VTFNPWYRSPRDRFWQAVMEARDHAVKTQDDELDGIVMRIAQAACDFEARMGFDDAHQNTFFPRGNA
jgi:hypothetical protein